MQRICAVEGCEKKGTRALGLCGAHYQAKWRKANPAKHASYATRWNKAHPEKHAASKAKWYKAHPGRQAFMSAHGWAKKHGVVDNLTLAEWNAALAYYGYACAYCEKPDTYGIDHVIPMSKGGPNSITNVVPCCKSCNSTKQDRDVEEFMATQNW